LIKICIFIILLFYHLSFFEETSSSQGIKNPQVMTVDTNSTPDELEKYIAYQARLRIEKNLARLRDGNITEEEKNRLNGHNERLLRFS
jgi:hypothetical protein